MVLLEWLASKMRITCFSSLIVMEVKNSLLYC